MFITTPQRVATLNEVEDTARNESLSWAARAMPIRLLSDHMGYPLDFEGMSDEDVVREYLA